MTMRLSKTQAYDEYKSFAAANDGTVFGQRPIGQRPFAKIYDAVGKVVELKHSLSYYFTDVLKAFGCLSAMTDRALVLFQTHHDPVSMDGDHWSEFRLAGYSLDDLRANVRETEHFSKSGLHRCFQVDASRCDGNALHCVAFAVGAPCNEVHSTDGCSSGTALVTVAKAFKLLVNAVANGLAREHEGQEAFSSINSHGVVCELHSMLQAATWCDRTINLYHRHVARAAWQANAIRTARENLQPDTVFIVLDHKQKILPSYNRARSAQREPSGSQRDSGPCRLQRFTPARGVIGFHGEPTETRKTKSGGDRRLVCFILPDIP
jgi:hypothetical protein